MSKVTVETGKRFLGELKSLLGIEKCIAAHLRVGPASEKISSTFPHKTLKTQSLAAGGKGEGSRKKRGSDSH